MQNPRIGTVQYNPESSEVKYRPARSRRRETQKLSSFRKKPTYKLNQTNIIIYNTTLIGNHLKTAIKATNLNQFSP